MNKVYCSRRVVLSGIGAALAFAGAGRSAGAVPKALAFRGIRYGKAERFGPASVMPFTESLIQTRRGSVSPQLPSRLAFAMGPMAPMRQDEHCQILSVFTPSRSGKRPVMVFLHGGAFITGGGEVPWYDGDRLAAEGDVVVVPVTYRLGALGFFALQGSNGPSPAITDQIAALQWIKTNIAGFGGDPENIAIFGQSAGGASIINLLAWGYGGKLFHRAIVQSGAGGPSRSRAEAEAVSKQFATEALGKDPHPATPAEILAAQVKLIGLRKGDTGWDCIAPDTVHAPNVPIICGWTREDLSPFILLAENKAPNPNADMTPFRKATEEGLAKPGRELVAQVTAGGQKAYLYEFAWDGPKTGLGDCHTIELAFLLGNPTAWSAAPMLKGADWNDVARLGRQLRAEWASFARSGDPAAVGRPAWRQATNGSQPVTMLA
jgi:para-nitrobenzyl esterase